MHHNNTRSVLNDGPRDRLRVSRPLYLGGLPGHVGEAALGLWHLRNTTSLRGCVLGLSINNKQLDFLQAAARVGGVTHQHCNIAYMSAENNPLKLSSTTEHCCNEYSDSDSNLFL